MNLKRNLYILKCRAYVLTRHLIEKILLKLSEWDLIYCHRVGFTNNTDDGKIHPAPDITSDRFIFSVSYVLRKIESKHEYWFETLKGKRIFTVEESYHVEHRISYRANLKAFYAHFSPKQRMWVDYTSPIVQLFENKDFFSDLSKDEITPIKVETHRCDFSKCRYAFDFCYAPDLNTHGVPFEVLTESQKALEVQLTSKVSEINKTLTGADYDGEIVSPDKTPLCDNLLCRKCGLPLFASKRKYSFWCIKHGELEYPDVQRVDPVMYANVLDNTMEILEDLIAHFDTTECPQDSNL